MTTPRVCCLGPHTRRCHLSGAKKQRRPGWNRHVVDRDPRTLPVSAVRGCVGIQQDDPPVLTGQLWWDAKRSRRSEIDDNQARHRGLPAERERLVAEGQRAHAGAILPPECRIAPTELDQVAIESVYAGVAGALVEA